MSTIHNEVENLWGPGLEEIMRDLKLKSPRLDKDHSLKEFEKGPENKEPFFFDPKELDI